MLTSREGLTIDVVAANVRDYLLSPAVSVPLAACLTWPPLFSKIQPLLAARLSAKQISSAQKAARVAAIGGVLLYLNDFLNKQSANNWTRPSKWNWNEEIVLITGGSGGIGESIAKQLIQRNSRTRIVIVDYAPLGWTPPAGSRVFYYQCDLSNSAKLKETCQKVRSEVGHPTVLVNNAGVARGKTLMEGSYGDVELTIRTNLLAPLFLAKEFLPEMVKRNHGHIVTVGSMSAIIPPERLCDYAASKAGAMAMHESLQMELKHAHNARAVRQTLCMFSFIRTPLLKGEPAHAGFTNPFLHVDSVAEAIVKKLYSGYGGTVYMPGIMRYIAALKGGPEWYFMRFRDMGSKTKLDFKGRYKVDEETGAIQSV